MSRITNEPVQYSLECIYDYNLHYQKDDLSVA